jgi:methionine synthase II (cobalamin-independent)
MRRSSPPFRADHVGSLLRPERLLRAPEEFAAGQPKRRIDEASQYVPPDQFCLSARCGFSSTVEDNALTYDEEVAKLRLIVDVARDVWGE